MSWSAALLALLVSHLVGDVLLQTEWQARKKPDGLGDRIGRRALVQHVAVYTVCFVPALVWIGAEVDAARAGLVGALVALPHLLIDDGRFVDAWLHRVKRVREPAAGLAIAVDQSFHVLCLAGAALAAAA